MKDVNVYSMQLISLQEVFQQYQPNLCCVYETENQCTGTVPKPCCERTCVSAQGGAAILGTSLILVSLALFLSFFVGV